ncbi:MAG: sugar transferase [Pseudanabaenaceae cyanobacterium bins.68]|nr:sugar transferase [Pseudanabaenaceae cyanobacterium bins.68]
MIQKNPVASLLTYHTQAFLKPIFRSSRSLRKSLSQELSYNLLGKRIFDILFALSVLIIFSPVYLLLALLIQLSSPGPVLYVQARVGKNGRLFNCMKFRTMVVNADQVLEQLLDRCPASRAEFEHCYKLKQDPRITPIGKWLRMTSLDEFPQFWNVLIGDMSIVGPRPLVPEELPKYGEAIDQVLTIRPGITGLWQVSGRNDIPYEQRVQIDTRYVRRHSIFLDLEIIFKTIGVVIFPKGNGAY